jgi:2-polyprenyl-3-methyl-5-hydroxy-6-metoxy-1,4-benzoquinol methylase
VTVEWRLFEPDTVPEWTTPGWYAGRERAPHLEQDFHQARLHKAAKFVEQAATDYGLRTVVDLGAGDGGLLSLLKTSDIPGLKAWGYDLQRSNTDAAFAERGVDVYYGDITADHLEWGQVAVATELLEHLVDPRTFVRRIAEHSKVLVASSPAWETGDSHYEFHTFAWDYDGYRALLDQGGFDVIRHEDAGGFQVALGVQQ